MEEPNKEIIEKIREYAIKPDKACNLDELMTRYGKRYEQRIEVVAMPMSDWEAEDLADYVNTDEGVEHDGMLIEFPDDHYDWLPQKKFDQEYKCVDKYTDIMLQEEKELIDRIMMLKLRLDYCNSRNTTSRILMQEQLKYMEGYKNMLHSRIDFEVLKKAQDKRINNLAELAKAFGLDCDQTNTNQDQDKDNSKK